MSLLSIPALLASRLPTEVTQPVPEQPPGTAAFGTLLNYGLWVITIIGVLGIFMVAGSMILQQSRGEGSVAISRLGWVLGGLILATMAAFLVNTIVV